MKTLSMVCAGLFVGAVALGAVGCKKAGGDCAKAIDHGMEQSKADMQKMGMDDKTLQKLHDIGVQHCTDDKWPDDAIKCMTDAKTEVDSQACYAKLSGDQQKAMNQAAMAVMAQAAPAPAAPAPAAPAPAAPAPAAPAPGSASAP